MGRKPNESSIEFKKRILDQISPTFCAAKWFNATIWLSSGQTASCHHPPPHSIPIDEIKNNPSAIHNTVHKKLMRSQMLRGEKPRECEYCWKIEDMGRENSSDRIFKSDFYKDEDILSIKNKKWNEDIDLQTLEIAFDRICNFACSYCNAGYSTRWAQDIKKNGAYQNLLSDGRGAFMHDGSWADKFKSNEENPFIKAFWDWWPTLEQSLLELKVTGGEPLMSPELWKLFDYFENRESREDFLFSFNSNLGVNSQTIEKMLEKVKNIKKLGIYTSMEAVGQQAEYIRDGLDYELWKANVEKILSAKRLDRFVVMSTINALSLFSLTEFLDQCLLWKKHHGNLFPTVSLTILRFPSFMSPSVLPKEIKQERKHHLQRWYDTHKDNPLLIVSELDSLKRLIDYLDEVESPHSQSSELIQRQSDFRNFYEQYDIRRNKSFLEAFPIELGSWYQKIGLYDSGKIEALFEGNAVDGYHDPEELKRLAFREGIKLK